MSWLVPPRVHRPEILDDPATAWHLRERSHRDIVRSNRWLGGDRALADGLRLVLRGAPSPVSVLDLGAGLGATSHIVRDVAAEAGVTARCIALDLDEPLARVAAAREGLGVCASALDLPFADGAVDVTMCALLLHHFDEPSCLAVLGEAMRVSRLGVVVADLQRTRLAEFGLWLVSFPLGFHPVSRHDGMLSVRRAFTAAELHSLMTRAGGREVRVTKRAGFRLVGTCHTCRVPAGRPPA